MALTDSTYSGIDRAIDEALAGAQPGSLSDEAKWSALAEAGLEPCLDMPKQTPENTAGDLGRLVFAHPLPPHKTS